MYRVHVAVRRSGHIRHAFVALVMVVGLTLGSSAALAVTFPWVTTSTSAARSRSVARSVSVLADGTSIVTGQFAGTDVDLGDGIPRTSHFDGLSATAFTEKLSASGTVLWVNASASTLMGDSEGDGVSALADGTSIVTGRFLGTDVDLGDGVLCTSASGGTRDSAFVEKLSAGGSVIWVRTLSDASGGSSGTGVSTGADGTATVTGGFTGSDVDFGDGVRRTSARGGANASAFTERLSASGSVLWVASSTSIGASTAGAYAVGTGADGTSVVTGSFRGTDVDLGDGTLRTSPGAGAGSSAFMEKLSASGSVLWIISTTSPTSGVTIGKAASGFADGTWIITGGFRGTDVDFGDGIPRTSAHAGGSSSVFTEKLSAGGAVLWVRTSTSSSVSETNGFGASALADGTAIVTGYFKGIDVDLGDGVARVSAGNGTQPSAVTERVGGDGSPMWVTAVASATGSSSGNGVGTLADGTTIVAGVFAGTGVDFGDGIMRTSAFAGARDSTSTQMLLDVPQAPSAPAAVAGTRSATVNVTPLPGGSVTSTAVISAPAGGSCTITAPATSCVVEGLSSGTVYTFTARATNAAGEGPWSPVSNEVTPTASPTAPPTAGSAVLSARVLPRDAHLESGQAMRLGIRASNIGTDAAGSVRSCLAIPANLVVVRRGTARRVGRRWCFAITSIAPGTSATRFLTVRAASMRMVVRTIRGSVGAAGLPVARARATTVRITPRPRYPVTG